MKHARDDYNDLETLDKMIPDSEPVFLIRAQDIVGANAVRVWAYLNDAVGGDPELTNRALQHADRMDRWPTKKKSDL